MKLVTTLEANKSTAPVIGENSRESLWTVGYSNSEIDGLVASSVIGIE